MCPDHTNMSIKQHRGQGEIMVEADLSAPAGTHLPKKLLSNIAPSICCPSTSPRRMGSPNSLGPPKVSSSFQLGVFSCHRCLRLAFGGMRTVRISIL
ncbi:hypothetical protein AALO_G00279240 [Alosa alosa]|uniref:Uncharacterized protein n=1 Tax=Alosa alosa TaxID=278164 RepID=A0AAV6FIY9_9TELE|nr:hypothetical protein AALO_G00279240 [Alosa alosa]